MPLRSGEHGYGALAKTLHWLTVVALVAQFTIGYRLDVDDSGRGRGRGRGRGGDPGRGRGRGGEDDGGYLSDPGTLLTVHVLLGVLILTVAVIRVVVRTVDGLPPWAATLTPRERTLAHWTERTLLVLLFVVPATGIALVASGDDDVLPLHVAAHIAFFVALAAHLGLVLKHQLVDRDRLLGRML
jgi:cytochrome b561